MFSICALFYGDHSDLAHRCLGGLEANLSTGAPWIQDIRLGLNEVSKGSEDFIRGWAETTAIRHRIPVLIYRPDDNAWKYPLMRRFFYQAVPGRDLGSEVMWFDDDAYLEPQFKWREVADLLAGHDMLGHLYYWNIQGTQWEWVKKQSWYNPEVGPPATHRGKDVFLFAQGSWWVIRSSVLRKYDWPTKLLRHNGGDSMLGELFRHQRLRLGRYVKRVRVNADAAGKDSKSPRRGYREPPLGADLQESLARVPTWHEFNCPIRVYETTGWRDV